MDSAPKKSSPKAGFLTQILVIGTLWFLSRQKRPNQVQRRIKFCRAALTVIDREHSPILWGQLRAQLGNGLVELPIRERGEVLEQAIEHYTEALSVFSVKGLRKEAARTLSNLGVVYTDRTTGNRSDNLEESIKLFEEALTVRTREVSPEDWANTQHNLAAAYYERIKGERLDNVKRAIEHYKEALKVRTRDDFPEAWALTTINLGLAIKEHVDGDPEINVDNAIKLYKEALEVCTCDHFPTHCALALSNLAQAYSSKWDDRTNNVDRAIHHYEEALSVYTFEAFPLYWARTQHNLGLAYSNRIKGNRDGNLEKAIKYLEEALTVRTRETFPYDWALSTKSLASVYWDRVQGERTDNIKQATDLLEETLAVWTRETFPAEHRMAQYELGNTHFVQGQWEHAHTRYVTAIEVSADLLAAAYTETGRRAEVREAARQYASDAYSLLCLKRPSEALKRLEDGKTLLLSRALALNEVDLSGLPMTQRETLHDLRRNIHELEAEMRLSPETPARMGDRELADALRQARAELHHCIEGIRAERPDFMPSGLDLPALLDLIPDGGALVAPIFTAKGSAAFVVPHGTETVTAEHVIELEAFTDADLNALLRGPVDESAIGGWLGAYFNARDDVQAWHDVIETTGQMLWNRLMGPIAERLTSLHARHVLLMPQGGLGLLPLHAAWCEVEGLRGYFLDCYTVTYLTSAYARDVSQKRLSDTQRQARTLLAVVNPTEDLPFTPAEGEQVASLFGDEQSTVLPASKATADAVKQGVASYLHFACHGFYDWFEPMKSGLLLAEGERFTLAQIIGQLNLDACRLVTLSACETGITDIRQSPDEYLGLPTGFLQAGAPAVVSTLWAVNDLSTMLLMERFYQLHLKEGEDLPEALRQAQIWLRDVTAGELKKRFQDEEEQALDGNGHMPIERASEYYVHFAKLDSERRPYEHPSYWAAFTLNGA